MDLASDLAQIFDDFATSCTIQAKGDEQPRPVIMIVRALSSGSINSSGNMLSFIDKTTLARGANWGYGVILAADAPTGMDEETRLTITDSTGAVWNCDAAKALYGVDESRRSKVLVAWRLALRGKQRMVR